MLRLEFKSDNVVTRSGNKAGRDWETNAQEAWVLLKDQSGNVNPYPQKVVFLLDKQNGKVTPYEIGMYEYDVEASIYIGDFNGLRLGRPVLRKIQTKPLQQAA